MPAPNRDLDATMFRLMDGEATFEGLNFLVKSARDRRSPQSAVTVVSAKGCTFRGCVFTLDEDESKAVVAVLADADREMRMDPGTARPTPKLRFENWAWAVPASKRLSDLRVSGQLSLTSAACARVSSE